MTDKKVVELLALELFEEWAIEHGNKTKQEKDEELATFEEHTGLAKRSGWALVYSAFVGGLERGLSLKQEELQGFEPSNYIQ